MRGFECVIAIRDSLHNGECVFPKSSVFLVYHFSQAKPLRTVAPNTWGSVGPQPCIPNFTVNPFAFPRRMIPYFCLAYLVLLLEAVLRSVEKAGGREYHQRKGLESEREELGDAVCLCGNASPRRGPRGYFVHFSQIERILDPLISCCNCVGSLK